MELGACVLLPHGFDEHPDARYPLIVFHGHFPATFGGFREEPPDPGLEPDYSERFGLAGYNRIQQEHAHQLYLDWISARYGHLPDSRVARSSRVEVDPLAVTREGRKRLGRRVRGEIAWLATFGRDDPDITIAFDTVGVERDQLAVR